MIYTVGRKEAYEKCFEEQEQPEKLGKGFDLDGNPYEGGSVWKTQKEAQDYLDTNGLTDFSVYGVLADWEKHTEENTNYSYRNLLVTANLMKLIEDKELDGLIDEFTANEFSFDEDQIREILCKHFTPVLHELKTKIKKLKKENIEQSSKLTKVCVEGGYDICAKCGEAVYQDEMATIPAYRKKVEKLEKQLKELNSIEKQKKKEVIYRCGWCGHPTDKDGNCIKKDPDEYLKEHKGKKEELVNGECCPHGDKNPYYLA